MTDPMPANGAENFIAGAAKATQKTACERFERLRKMSKAAGSDEATLRQIRAELHREDAEQGCTCPCGYEGLGGVKE